MVVGPGAGHGQDFAGAQVGGEADVGGEDVTGFAVAPGDAGRHMRAGGVAVGDHGLVVRAVQGHARIVAHTAVHGDEGAPALDVFDGQHPVEGHARARDNGAAGLERDAGAREPVARTGRVEGVLDDVGEFGQIHLGVTGAVGDGMPATEIEIGEGDAVIVANARHFGDHPPHGLTVGEGVVDL